MSHDTHDDSERRRQWMREQLGKLNSPTPEDLTPEQQYARDARDYRLLIATIDGDEQRVDTVLDEEPTNLSPEMRAALKHNALDVVEQMETEHGRDQARRLLDAQLVRVHDEAEQHRDPVGHTLHQIASDELNAEFQKLDGESDDR